MFDANNFKYDLKFDWEDVNEKRNVVKYLLPYQNNQLKKESSNQAQNPTEKAQYSPGTNLQTHDQTCREMKYKINLEAPNNAMTPMSAQANIVSTNNTVKCGCIIF